MQYLAHRVSKSNHRRAGRKWIYKTLDDFVKVFPYLKRSTISDTLKRLAKANGPLVIGEYNRMESDRTCWYAFREDAIRKQAQSSKPVYFRTDDAETYGIVGAVLLRNLTHWIRENRKTDPSYTAHPMSPRELAKHLPFSKGAIQRALKDLVGKAITTMLPVKKGGTMRYALVDENRLVEVSEEGGPNPDGGGPDADMGGPNPDMGGPVSEMPGPNPDMGGPNPDNNTTLIEYPLIDTPLVDPPLVEPSYVEPVLPTWSQNASPDKLKRVIDVNPFARIVASGAHTRHQDQTTKNQSSESSAPEAPSVSTPLPSAPASPHATVPVSPSLPPAPASSSASAPPARKRMKLSRLLNSRFANMACALRGDEKKRLLGEMVRDFLREVIQSVTPEELLPLVAIGDQQVLYDVVCKFLAPHLTRLLTEGVGIPTTASSQSKETITDIAHQLLTQALCGYYDDNYASHCPWPYDLQIEIHRKLRIHGDNVERQHQEALKAQQAQTLQQRAQEYVSPDAAKECCADISPGEKVKVLRHSLHTRNSIGVFNDKNQLENRVVEYNDRAMDAAYAFFQANPGFTVADLNGVLDRCLQLPKEGDFREDGKDPLWHARKARDISFLIEHLDTIVASLNCVDAVPVFTSVPREELYRKRRRSER